MTSSVDVVVQRVGHTISQAMPGVHSSKIWRQARIKWNINTLLYILMPLAEGNTYF